MQELNKRKREGLGIQKALYIIDMNNGFVNFGPMANKAYNALVKEQRKLYNIKEKDGY